MAISFFNRIFGRFTARGRSLSLVDQGMAYANSHSPNLAIKKYTEVIGTSESPGDVIAMALFNRALVYTTISKEIEAEADLRAIQKMPDATAIIQRSASDKLVRMERKLKRSESIKEKEG